MKISYLCDAFGDAPQMRESLIAERGKSYRLQS